MRPFFATRGIKLGAVEQPVPSDVLGGGAWQGKVFLLTHLDQPLSDKGPSGNSRIGLKRRVCPGFCALASYHML